MAVYIALLRSINVGGNSLVKMEELRALFARLGHTDISTYIQSGNVVFRAKSGAEARVRAALEQGILDTFGFPVPVVLRTRGELLRAQERNPFLGETENHKELSICFLHDAPTPAAFAKIDPDRSPPDECRQLGRELYLRLPNGSGNTKLTLAYLEKCLGTTGTARNLNTVNKLLEMSGKIA